MATNNKEDQMRERIDWGSAEWAKSNRQLAMELKCGVTTVTNKRHALFGSGKSGVAGKVTRGRHDPVAWDRADWTKKNSEIAKDLGCDYSTVWLERKTKFGCGKQETASNIFNQPRKWKDNGFDWKGLDWGKKDAELAKELGCKTYVVHYRRGQTTLGKKLAALKKARAARWAKPVRVEAEKESVLSDPDSAVVEVLVKQFAKNTAQAIVDAYVSYSSYVRGNFSPAVNSAFLKWADKIHDQVLGAGFRKGLRGLEKLSSGKLERKAMEFAADMRKQKV